MNTYIDTSKRKTNVSIKVLTFFAFIFVPVVAFSQYYSGISVDEYESTGKSKMIDDVSSLNNNDQDSTQQNLEFIRNQSNVFSSSRGQVGKNISDSILSLELNAQNVAYAVDKNKLFTLTIKNVGKVSYTINLADDYVHNVFFDTYDELHVPVQIPSSLMVARNNDYVSYRSITLDPNEFLTLTVNLNSYANLNKPGVYKISSRFYPERYIDISQRGFAKSKSQHFVESNTLLISIVSSDSLTSPVYSEDPNNYVDIYNDARLITREYSPFDVVEIAMSRLKERDWESFFSYVDIYELFTNTVTTSDTFKLLSNEEKQVEINQFIKRVKLGTEISDLYPPDIFTIEETQFTTYNAKVQVSTQIPEGNSIIRYRYNFFLKKKTSGWKIVDYNIKYLGINIVSLENKFLGDNNEYVSPTEFSR